MFLSTFYDMVAMQYKEYGVYRYLYVLTGGHFALILRGQFRTVDVVVMLMCIFLFFPLSADGLYLYVYIIICLSNLVTCMRCKSTLYMSGLLWFGVRASVS